MTKMVNYGVSWGGGFLGHHQARLHQSTSMKSRKFQLVQRLCRCSQLASHGILGFPEPSTLQLVIWRLKLVNVLDLGSREPSMTKMVNYGVSWGGGGFLGHHQARLHQSTAVKLLKFQLVQRLCRSNQCASHWILDSAEPSTLQLVT